MKIIPAIDIIDGKCVRLSKGDFNTKKVYDDDPAEVARRFEAHGVQYLHLVDLDGAKSKQVVNHEVLARIARETNLMIDFGGGIKTTRDAKRAFDCGAHKITAGSIAVDDKEQVLEWIDEFGADRIILGADCKDRKISTHGWQETSEIDVITFIQEFQEHGMKEAVCTDISKDGMLGGASFALYRDILAQTDVSLIASGGVSALSDLRKLEAIGCSGAIIGKAIYEGKIRLEQLSKIIDE